MPRIPLLRARDGMVLLRPVTSPSGALLAGAGVKITEEIRAKLANGDVRHVYVLAGPDDGRLKHELSALKARFSKSEDVQPMRMLEELVREHLEELYR